VLELQQVSRGVLQEKGMMLDSRMGKALLGFLVKFQFFPSRPLQEAFPFREAFENQTEVPRINPPLIGQAFPDFLSDDLISP